MLCFTTKKVVKSPDKTLNSHYYPFRWCQMQRNRDKDEAGSSGQKLSSRDRYELEAHKIQSEIGDLAQILNTLGLSQRRACQLLLVDPSAWTRWRKTSAPPHIYQALRWLIELQKLNPALAGPRDLSLEIDQVRSSTDLKLRKIEADLTLLGLAIAAPAAGSTRESNEAAQEAQRLQWALIEERRQHIKRIEELEAEIRSLRTAKSKKPKRKSKKALKPLAKLKAQPKNQLAKKPRRSAKPKSKSKLKLKPKPKAKLKAKKAAAPARKKQKPRSKSRARLKVRR
jgi:hypothetical protein